MSASLQTAAAYVLTVMMLGSAGLHLYWVLGGTWFLATAANVPEGDFFKSTTMIAVTWIFIAGMLAAAYLALGRIGQVGRWIPQRLYTIGLWGLTVVTGLGALFNIIIIGPRVWDRLVFGPILVVLAVCAFVLARSRRQRVTRA
ncbi:MAG: DUF3995 domain-containing protein [candidate division Zixibacteria bacterium]|nr:DUF3995 domain-containing protein [candidate division Zixibacteria bacterium]